MARAEAIYCAFPIELADSMKPPSRSSWIISATSATPLRIPCGISPRSSQFMNFLTPPGEKTMPPAQIDHRVIREFVGCIYDRQLAKSSVARKLAALRTFFKFWCAKEMIKIIPRGW